MKTKWLKLTIPVDIFSLSEKLHFCAYKTGMDFGFEILSYDDNQLNAKYFERHVEKEVIEDPFGEVSEVEMIRYQTIDFSIFSLERNNAVLMIENPPRSVKGLIFALSQSIGFGFFIEVLNLNIYTFISFLKKTFGGSAVKILSLRANNIRLTEKTTGVIEVVSIGDALSDVNSFFKNNEIKIVKVKMNIFSGGSRSILSVSDTGHFIFPEELFYIVKDYMSNALTPNG